MDPGAADAPGGSGDLPSPSPSSAAAAAVAAAAGKEEELPLKKSDQDTSEQTSSSAQQAQPAAPAPAAAAAAAATSSSSQPPPSRYESQKRRDWNTFLQYLKNQKPPLTLPRCGGAHVIDFLKYLDQFGKTKVHAPDCPHFGRPAPPAPCACPLRQAWGSLDALIGRLRAAYEESGGRPEANPFGAKAVRAYLREVRESQAKARGIPYEKKKRKRLQTAPTAPTVEEGPSSTATVTASGAVDSKTIEAEGSRAPQPGAAGGDTKTASGAVDSKTKEAEGSSAPQPGAAGGDTKTTSGAEGSKTKTAEGSSAPQPGAAGGDTKTTTTTTTSSC